MSALTILHWAATRSSTRSWGQRREDLQANHPPGYPNSTIYHYFTVYGYNAATRQVRIADSANFGGNKMYWLSFDQLAT